MTILLLEKIDPLARLELEQAGAVLCIDDPEAALDFARRNDVAAILTRGRMQVRRPLLDACPALRVIARVGVGLDNIDVDAASARGIPVVNAPGSTTAAVAEHTMLLMLALARRLYPLTHAVKAGNWAVRSTHLGDELAGKTLGIVGMGAIGRRVAELAGAFGMSICYWSRTRKDVPYAYYAMPDVLTAADVVSLHTALTPGTRRLIDSPALTRMKPTAMLVNTARGGLVDQQALYVALAAHRLAGYAADVLDPEPPLPNDPLPALDNVLVTPHTAALTRDTFRRMSLRTVRNVAALLGGRAPEDGCIANAAELLQL